MAMNLPLTDFEMYIEPERTGPSDGASATSIVDYSGNSRNLVASGTAPIYKTNIINGKPVVRFDGVADFCADSSAINLVCGWIVVKFDATTFSGYQGVLTDSNAPLITSDNTGTNFRGFGYEDDYLFEFRSNDQIYPDSAAPAPMTVFRLIFFRFWKSLPVFAIQIGQDRNFTDRKFDGDLAFLALSSKNYCEETIREYSETIATNFGLTLADVIPTRNLKSDVFISGSNANLYLPPEGDMIAELIDTDKLSASLSFENQRQSEFKEFQQFHADHFPDLPIIFRNYATIPPIDHEGYFTTGFRWSGYNNRFNFSTEFKEK